VEVQQAAYLPQERTGEYESKKMAFSFPPMLHAPTTFCCSAEFLLIERKRWHNHSVREGIQRQPKEKKTFSQ
jgi:hypothetical protein